MAQAVTMVQELVQSEETKLNGLREIAVDKGRRLTTLKRRHREAVDAVVRDAGVEVTENCCTV